MTVWKGALIAGLSLCAGFVAGAWFLSSDLAIRKILVPAVPPGVPQQPVTNTKRVSIPRTVAVGLPKGNPLTSSGWGNLDPPALRTDLLPTPGCDWVVEPRPFHPGRLWNIHDSEENLAGTSVAGPGGGLQFLLFEAGIDSRPGSTVRPVFFDAEAARHLGRSVNQTGSMARVGASDPGRLFRVEEFLLDPARGLPADKVAFFGVERVRPESAGLATEAARREAEAKGIATLPYPALGRPYPFDLTAVAGERVRSADLRGKVVVVAAWGPTRSDTVFPILKQIRQNYPLKEVAFVDVSFDGSADEARLDHARALDDGALVFVPNDATTRRIWTEAAGIERLPHFFVLDREGTLRASCALHELRNWVDDLMGRGRPGRPLRRSPAVASAKRPAAPPSPGQAPR